MLENEPTACSKLPRHMGENNSNSKDNTARHVNHLKKLKAGIYEALVQETDGIQICSLITYFPSNKTNEEALAPERCIHRQTHLA